MAISTGIDLNAVSRVVGYELGKALPANVTTNLPQRIAIFGEYNTDKQASVTENEPETVTSATRAAELYGYGSPIHQMMRILRPRSGSGVGTVPTVVFPIKEHTSATAATLTITVTGPATANGTHYVKVNGRAGIDGEFYSYSIANAATAVTVAAAIKDAINAVTASPVTAAVGTNVGVDDHIVTLTTKWKGLSAAELACEIDQNEQDTGITYVVSATSGGAETESLSTAIANMEGWYTIVINQFGNTLNSTWEADNGVPGIGSSTGNYSPREFKPYIALWGYNDPDVSDITTITDAAARKDQVTNVLCPAPNSKGFTWEAAANVAAIIAPVFQNTPHLDVNGKSYPDMPIPTDENIGDMSSYLNRDTLVKAGASTVNLTNGKYTIQDLITTYHPDGEVPPAWRYCRNLNIDWNIRYTYYLLEVINVVDKVLVGNDDIVTVSNTVKPKQWKAILFNMFDSFERRALISDSEYSQDETLVEISESNPDRIETFFKYKRTGTARISSTSVEAGFNFGETS